MNIFLRVIVSLLISGSANCWAAAEINLSRSQLAKLGENLESVSNEQKHEFARISLAQLYMTYEQELDRSLGEIPANINKKKKLDRWRTSTEFFLKEIDYALGQVLTGSNYDFFVNQQDRIIFSVPGKILMLSGPNRKAEKMMESKIINQFCSLYDCRNYLSFTEKQYFAKNQSTVNGYWLMDRKYQADYFTNIGIIFRFDNLKHRKEKEHWSLNLTRDLLFLVKTLEITQAKGYVVDFTSISISKKSAQNETVKLIINQKGDFIYLNLPLLSSSFDDVELLNTWLKKIQSKDFGLNSAIVVLSDWISMAAKRKWGT